MKLIVNVEQRMRTRPNLRHISIIDLMLRRFSLTIAGLVLSVFLVLGQEKNIPLYVFGVVSDVQYADKEMQGPRHFRLSLQMLKEAVENLNNYRPGFVIQLGDIIDGHRDDANKTIVDLDAALGVFNKFEMPKYHVIGNHCMIAGQEVLQQKLAIENFYYDFTIDEAKGYHFIVLDGNDAGYGVIGEKQLGWFKLTLRTAAQQNEKVIVFCHYPLLREAAKKHRMAEPEPILKLIDESNCVVAWFAGHDHEGGYALRKGVHHITVKGIVEAQNNAYSLIELYPDKIVEKGFGSEPSRILTFPTDLNCNGN